MDVVKEMVVAALEAAGYIRLADYDDSPCFCPDLDGRIMNFYHHGKKEGLSISYGDINEDQLFGDAIKDELVDKFGADILDKKGNVVIELPSWEESNLLERITILTNNGADVECAYDIATESIGDIPDEWQRWFTEGRAHDGM